jgi:hypothetical protein
VKISVIRVKHFLPPRITRIGTNFLAAKARKKQSVKISVIRVKHFLPPQITRIGTNFLAAKARKNNP